MPSRDPLDTATEFHTMHPEHPADRTGLYADLLCAGGYIAIIIAILYLALES